MDKIDDTSRCPLNILATRRTYTISRIMWENIKNPRFRIWSIKKYRSARASKQVLWALRGSKKENASETYEDPWLYMSTVTKTRWTPDLMLERDAFLWTTMKGNSDSEVAIEAEINARNTRADTERCFLILISIFFFQFTDGHSLSHGSFLSSTPLYIWNGQKHMDKL